MQHTKLKILSRIYGHRRGWVFTPKAFIDIAGPRTVGVVLSRLVSDGKIRRLAQGLYVYPKMHEKLGALTPSVEEIVGAIAQRDQIRLLASGAYAANLLGLSEQVPAKIVFLTDGQSRKIAIGKLSIEFRKTAPRHMSLAGKESGVVIQALRHLGQEQIDRKIIEKLGRLLRADTKKEVLKDIALAPAWMRPLIKAITELG